ncbi:helix-turn-helix domain-containing protein [Paucilactobacillus hokkaidonensis]|nr:XRE family transcriptional regulator [Paucilactobacillus hokkaidonensis]KRO09884.1 transcriptional regulator [Paucilactobacillus hokkaidonensis]
MAFNGASLQNAREVRGLSRNQLANLLNVSEQTIWQYEVGETKPKFESLVEFKKLFGVELGFFQRFEKQIPVFDEKNIAYRSSLRSSIKKKNSEKAFLENADSLITDITSNVILEHNLIIQLRQKMEVLKNKNASIDEMAYEAREVLKVSADNHDLMIKVENAGVFVIERKLQEDVDAYSSWSYEDKAYIVLGNQKRSGTRRNFDIVHELGHLLMHYQWDFSNSNSPEYRRAEREANEFAADFLMPSNLFIPLFNNYVTRPSIPDQYEPLKKRLNVSLSALGVRASHLKLIDGKTYRYFFASMTRKDYRYNEPLEAEIPYVRPGKIRAIFELQTRNNSNYVNRFLTDRGIKLRYLDNSLGIEPDFFVRLLPQRRKVSENKIIKYENRECK